MGNIFPPISDEEFRESFMFGPDKFPEVLACLQLPSTPARAIAGLASFPYRFAEDGTPTRWVTQETALLVFLKRLTSRGSTLISLEKFFGRSVGWICEVSLSVLGFLKYRWIPTKVHSLDPSVFDKFRLHDYATCLWRAGLRLPGVVGFVDGTFHQTYRPGRDGYNGQLRDSFIADRKPVMEFSSNSSLFRTV